MAIDNSHCWQRECKQTGKQVLTQCEAFELLKVVLLPHIKIEPGMEYFRTCSYSYECSWTLCVLNFIK